MTTLAVTSAGAAVILTPSVDASVKLQLPVDAVRLCPFVRDVVASDTFRHPGNVVVPCTSVGALRSVVEYVLVAHANAAMPMLTIHRPMPTWDPMDALVPAWAVEFAERVPLEHVRDMAATAALLRMPMLFHLLAARVASAVAIAGDAFALAVPATDEDLGEQYNRLREKLSAASAPFEDPDSTPAEIAAARELMLPVPLGDPAANALTPRRPQPVLSPQQHEALVASLVAVAHGTYSAPRADWDEFGYAVMFMIA